MTFPRAHYVYTNTSKRSYSRVYVLRSLHLEALDVTVQALAIVPDRVETQHVAVVLDEPSPPAVVHRVAESGLREDFHVVLLQQSVIYITRPQTLTEGQSTYVERLLCVGLTSSYWH